MAKVQEFIILLIIVYVIGSCSCQTILSIALTGKEHVLRCDGSEGKETYMFWRYLDEQDKSLKDIFDNFAIVDNYRHNFEATNKTTDLKIKQISNKEAGIYKCPTDSINLIVIEDNITCDETPKTASDMVRLYQINCSFSFKAGESCHVTPSWNDLDEDRNITKDEMDHDTGYQSGYLWLRFHEKSSLNHVRRLGLGVIFNCNSHAPMYYYTKFVYDRHRSYFSKWTILLILLGLIIAINIVTIVGLAMRGLLCKKSRIANRGPPQFNSTPELRDINLNLEGDQVSRSSNETLTEPKSKVILKISIPN